MKAAYMRQVHPFDPIYNTESKILILGSFPSVKSREANFYYAHAQNRFWRLLSYIYDEDEPKSARDKKNLLFNHNIAIWDIIKSCDISGSSDVSIKNIVINDIFEIIEKSKIDTICFNGIAAYKIYNKYCLNKTNIKTITLPSTSPANAQYSLDRLALEWENAIKQMV
ncbi:MAG: DNA-deoxyinosine glycosylase [Clostridia bacterium]